MNVKLILTCIALLLIGLAAGWYAKPDTVITKTVEVEKRVIDQNRRKDVVIDKRVNPDGSSQTVTHIIDDSTTKITDKKESKNETINNNPKNWNISALASPDISTHALSYGVHVQRKFLGPISIGAFGLTNKTFGLSVGIEF